MESDLVPGIHSKQTKVRRSNNALGQGSSTGSLATVTGWRRRSLHAVVLLKNMFSLRCFFSFKYFTTKRSQQESLSPLSKQPVKIQVYEQKILKFTMKLILFWEKHSKQVLISKCEAVDTSSCSNTAHT
uniref:Uncharacterized protein n=1 Tax=Glossina austeni TaxID=7395 RepID=A0A1A9USH4_GLOAU